MINVSLKSIKYESIKLIFSSIVNADVISRADISKETGLSLVTVGKIADALLDHGVISQAKSIHSRAGRRANVISINESKFVLVIDLTSYNFSCSLLNLQMSQIYKNVYTYKSSLSYKENLNVFLRDVIDYLKKNNKLDDCIGVGITVPGAYDSEYDIVDYPPIPELSTCKMLAEMKKVFVNKFTVIDSYTNAAAKLNIVKLDNQDETNVLYWYVGKEYISGAFACEGELITGKNSRSCDFGSMLVFDGLTLEDKLKFVKNQEECAAVLSPVVYNVVKVFSPHTVIMEFETDYKTDDIITLIKNDLAMKYRVKNNEMPAFIGDTPKNKSAHKGLAIELIDLWLKKIVNS